MQGSWHLHLILFFQSTPPACKSYAEKAWRHGIVDEKKVENNGLGFYLSMDKGRFHLYPTGLRIVRTSRGLKKPQKQRITVTEAEKELGGAVPVKPWDGRINTDQNGQGGFQVVVDEYAKADKK
jgi:hypothetical protein